MWGKLIRSGGSEVDPSIIVPNELVFGNTEDDVFFGRTNPSASDLETRGFTHTNQVVISVPYASATHFKISRGGTTGQFILTDLSRNGTVVNDSVVSNNCPVPLATGDRIGLKFKTDTKVEYTFHALPVQGADEANMRGEKAISQQQQPQCDQVLLEQLQKCEHTCRAMTEEHATMASQIGMLESQLAEVIAGRAADKSAAAAEQKSAAADKARLLDDHRVQMLDANSAAAATSARCAELGSKLEDAQRLATEQTIKAKAAAAQVIKLQEQLQDQSTMLQGTRESYMSGQAKNTAANARLEELQFANAALESTLEKKEEEWVCSAAAATQSLQTHESKLRETLQAVLSIVPSLSSCLQQLQQAGDGGLMSLELLSAGVLHSIQGSSNSSNYPGGVKPQQQAGSQHRSAAADTLTQASELCAVDENMENMDEDDVEGSAEIEAEAGGGAKASSQSPSLKPVLADQAPEQAVGSKRGSVSQRSSCGNSRSNSHSQSQGDAGNGKQSQSQQEEEAGSHSPVSRLRSQPQETSPSVSQSSQRSSKRGRS